MMGLRTEATRLRDEHGRHRVFHGINLVAKGNRRPTGSYVDRGFRGTWTADDIADLAARGLTLVRLGILWAAVEPEPGRYDEEYLDWVGSQLDLIGAAGMFAFPDAHQDLYSQAFEDGAPAWATLTDHEYAATEPWSDAYLSSPAVHEALDRFWEKFYFRPGNLGYPVFDTAVGRVGMYICYDRHFPEGWRELGLADAHMVFNPNATKPGLSNRLWEIEGPAAAVANGYFVLQPNRVGREDNEYGDLAVDFYGTSQVIDPRGNFVGERGSGEHEELLVHTGEMTGKPAKRSYDTALLMYELIAYGLDDPQGREAVRIINRAHRPWPISDDDFRYVLAALIVVPMRWIEHRGWRPLLPAEREASAAFYRDVARHMNGSAPGLVDTRGLQ